MFNDQYLIDHLDRNQSIKVEAGCFIEINQNDPKNIDTVGVFKYGAYNYTQLRQWTGNPATYWVHRNVVTQLQSPIYDVNDYQWFAPRKKADYFSLVDCFTEFRPRSGINKLVQPVGEGRTFVDDFKAVRRPRFYPASTTDNFKYWTSWNTDEGPFVGLSTATGAISNAAPFVVYKEPVAMNRVTVKIQTGIGKSISTINSKVGTSDPLNNPALSTIPKIWKIQYLDVFNTWQTIKSFTGYDPAVLDPETGHLDLVFMVKNPNTAAFPNFVLKGYFDDVTHLPIRAYDGEAFCIGRSATSVGRLWVWSGGMWQDTMDIDYEWRIADPTMNPEEYATKDFIDPVFYNPTAVNGRGSGDAYDAYSGIVFARGLRILVDAMVARDKPFELIELSPRLFANVSEMVINYSVDKAITSEDSVLPVGELSVSNGTVTLSNMDLALNREMEYDVATRKGSILANRVRRNTKFLFYEIIREVDVNGVKYDKFVPVKNLYVVDKPITLSGSEDVSITLRDLNFRFEELKAPNIVLKECSLTKAVATLLDSIGFTNYIFYFGDRATYRKDLSPLETVIPYFFINETQSIAEVLEQLAIATQCAMFFDEYNNFVVMPREHFDDEPQYVLRGGSNRDDGKYANIESIDIEVTTIADAEIKYTHRDIARGTLPLSEVGESGTRTSGEAGNITAYKPSGVWDVSKMEGATLSAGPLNSPLSASLPQYSPTSQDGVTNNTFDLGIYAEQFPFKGMVSMNGEVIEFDAKEYMIGGRQVWVNSQSHLTELVGRSSFSMADKTGQMVFPTGKMRIVTELSQNDNGTISLTKHGRGMFGTPVQYHTAEPVEWTQGASYKFTDVALDSLYGKVDKSEYTYGQFTDNGVAGAEAVNVTSTNYIYNSLHSRNRVMGGSPITIDASSVTKLNAERRIMRSSALTFGGLANAGANDVIMKTHVIPGGHYNLFGTRIGIVGKQFKQEEANLSQNATGSTTLGTYSLPDDETLYTVEGAGGGMTIFNQRHAGAASNDGYYFELMALSSSYEVQTNEGVQSVVFANVNFYKINRGKRGGAGAALNVPVKLFSTYADILVTSGSQTVRDRTVPSELTTVYDLAIEASQVGTFGNYQRVFHLYINDMLVGVVYEPQGGANGYFPNWDSSPAGNTEIGVFVRGASEIQVEHIYAVGTDTIDPEPIYSETKLLSRPRAFKVFSPSAIYTTGRLNGGRSTDSVYYEEFGTTAREVKNIKAKFDVYPVMISQIAKRPIFDRAFSISGYNADPYHANFMLWSQADRLLDLGAEETTVSIIGLPFADNEEKSLTIDAFLTGQYEGSSTAVSYDQGNAFRKDLLNARSAGQTEKIEFESLFIQNSDYATKMMRWLSGFMGREMTTLTVTAFGVPHLQIGDIVTVDYDIPYLTEDTVPEGTVLTPLDPLYVQKHIAFIDNNKRFMIQSISVDRDNEGPEYVLRLVEMPSVAEWNAGDF